MEKSSKRGKIPQQDWPSIIARYEAGETLSSIARTYDCSPPAISYIVSRTRARSAAAEAPTSKPLAPVEPQLIKAPASPSKNGIPADGETHNGPLADDNTTSIMLAADSVGSEMSSDAPRPSERGLFPEEPLSPGAGQAEHSSEINRPAQRDGDGDGDAARPSRPLSPSGGPSQNGEARRTLHLSLSQGNVTGSESYSPRAQNAANPADGSDDRSVARPPRGQPGFAQEPRPASGHALPLGPPPSPLGAVRGPASAPPESHRPREGGAFIDHTLRERIDGDIAAFLAAFDAALDHDTAESRSGLREATDRLLRAGARTRIELERLEARVPLTSRHKDSPTSSAYRPR
jgi:hypothetical protein